MEYWVGPRAGLDFVENTDILINSLSFFYSIQE
jgi:hypothetical protein